MEKEKFYSNMEKLEVLERLEIGLLVENILYKDIIYILNKLLDILDLKDGLYKVWFGRIQKDLLVGEYLEQEQKHISRNDSLSGAKSQIGINIIFVLDSFLKGEYESALNGLNDVFDYSENIGIDDDNFYGLLYSLGQIITRKMDSNNNP